MHTKRPLEELKVQIQIVDLHNSIQSQQEMKTKPEELEHLKGDCSKAKETLGWEHEYTFETMLDEMIEYWLEHYEK